MKSTDVVISLLDTKIVYDEFTSRFVRVGVCQDTVGGLLALVETFEKDCVQAGLGVGAG